MDGEWNEREYLEIPSRRALFVGVIRSSRSKFAGAEVSIGREKIEKII